MEDAYLGRTDLVKIISCELQQNNANRKKMGKIFAADTG